MIPPPALVAVTALAAVALCGCGRQRPDPRGVDRDEVLLRVSATGTAENAPTEARFSVGLSSIAATGPAASEANAAKMNAIVAALAKLGVEKKDLQTQRLFVARIGFGPNRNRFEASNTVTVRVRRIDQAGPALAAATAAGANVLSGPDLRVGDPEAAALTAYANAYKAARTRAETYAKAAGLKVARVLTITDGGGAVRPVDYSTIQTAAPVAQVAPPVMGGTDTSAVRVSVDFALAK